MKHQIRKSVFETNSSSVHAIAIGKKGWNNLPDEVEFSCGQFGWERESYSDISSRASYLWTAVWSKYQESWCPDDENKDLKESPDYSDYKDYISETLGQYGVVAKFFTPSDDDFCYIDHVSSLYQWVDKIRNSEELLMMFLFSPDSIILTGNDNDGDYPDVNDFDEDNYLDIEEKYN